MKKIILFVCTSLMALIIFGVYSSGNWAYGKTLNEYLISNSIKLTRIIGSFAQSDGFIELHISGAPYVTDIIKAIGAYDYTYPNGAVIIRVPDRIIDFLIENMAGELDLPDDAYELFVTRMFLSVPNIINSWQGVSILTAASILSANKSFHSHKDFYESTYVILIYDSHSSITSFRKSSEGIITASSTFLFLSEVMEGILIENRVVEYLYEIFDITGFSVEFIDF